jgi:hypothetical protein
MLMSGDCDDQSRQSLQAVIASKGYITKYRLFVSIKRTGA